MKINQTQAKENEELDQASSITQYQQGQASRKGWRKVLEELESNHSHNTNHKHSPNSLRTKYNLDGSCIMALQLKVILDKTLLM